MEPRTVWARLGIYAFGPLMVFLGLAMLSRGMVAYDNYERATCIPSRGVVTRGFFLWLALIPDSLVARFVKQDPGATLVEWVREVSRAGEQLSGLSRP